MQRVLRPGMHLMRQLGVAGKFGLIAVLLLLPMLTSMTTAFRADTERISAVSTERDGLDCVLPLTRLVIELAESRNLSQHGQRSTDGWMSIVRELDAAVAQHGEDFGVVSQWQTLRVSVVSLTDPLLSSADFNAGTETAARQAQVLATTVADASKMTLDPDLDSYYLVQILIDRLPRLMLSAVQIEALRSAGDASDSLDLSVSTADFTDTASQIGYDLATATTWSSWPGLHGQVSAESWSLNDAARNYASELQTAADADTNAPIDLTGLSSSATSLAGGVGSALDQLLVQRSDRLIAERAQPLMLTLIVLALVFYLLAALFRATTDDVRTVLADISTVTNGAVHQTSPLSGSDEFSQMSRAIIYARDRLTALVGTLQYQATHDELTALANRRLFTEKVEEALATSPPTAAATGTTPRVAVLLIDLDAFKSVNDSFGHELGDRLLRTVGARIHRSVPRRSVVARLGSDEFAVLVTDTRHQGSPRDVVDRLASTLGQPIDIEGRMISVRAGIGLALASPGAGVSAVELVRNADVALSYAKNRGTGHSVVFEPAMHDQTRERTELSAELVSAIDRGEMRLLYQPLVDLETHTLHGVEALLRWEHPERGPISPAVFVPLAEATGQIGRIGQWVLDEACRRLADWQQGFPDAYPLVMEVNLAPSQLAATDLVAAVIDTVQETGIDPAALVLEITESALVDDLDTAMTRLAQLSAIGLTLALDDFGTGYSSLNYLRRLPVTVLKIDKAFVSDETVEGQALLRGIADLGTGQGMQIVAEGIETIEQARFVRAAGCHIGQGHLWAPALPPEAITEAIRRGGRMIGATTDLPAQRHIRLEDHT